MARRALAGSAQSDLPTTTFPTRPISAVNLPSQTFRPRLSPCSAIDPVLFLAYPWLQQPSLYPPWLSPASVNSRSCSKAFCMCGRIHFLPDPFISPGLMGRVLFLIQPTRTIPHHLHPDCLHHVRDTVKRGGSTATNPKVCALAALSPPVRECNRPLIPLLSL